MGLSHNSYQVTQKTFKTQIKQNFDHFPWSNLPNKKDIVHRCSFQRLWLFPQRLMGTLATSYLAFFFRVIFIGRALQSLQKHLTSLHIVWKRIKMSHFDFRLWHFPPVFCPFESGMSGNTVWLQASGFQKTHQNWPFLALITQKCKLSSLRSQCWMRLFLWFSNIVEPSRVDTKNKVIKYLTLFKNHPKKSHLIFF